jgi:hypothetical protein
MARIRTENLRVDEQVIQPNAPKGKRQHGQHKANGQGGAALIERTIDEAIVAGKAAPAAPRKTAAPAISEDTIALQFAQRHADDLRYVAFRGRWLQWAGWRWLFDETLSAFDLSRAVCREHAAVSRSARAAVALASAKTVAAVERLAKADRRIAATTNQWDGNPDIFNTPTEAT